eukprot:3642700-Pleurochrysis_carterae.AAC.1
MSEAMARYAGYRHIRSLSYNPQSNGLAEKGVKRISDLLVRQTHHLRDWHLTLPMITAITKYRTSLTLTRDLDCIGSQQITFALNTTVHRAPGERLSSRCLVDILF